MNTIYKLQNKIWSLDTDKDLTEDEAKELPEVKKIVFNFKGRADFERKNDPNKGYGWIIKDVEWLERDEYMKEVIIKQLLGNINDKEVRELSEGKALKSYQQIFSKDDIQRFEQHLHNYDEVIYPLTDGRSATIRMSDLVIKDLSISFHYRLIAR